MTIGTMNPSARASSNSAAEVQTPAKTRMAYVDRLRVVLTMLVVAHHAGQAYGPNGGNWPITDPTTSPVLGPFFAVNSMFFMGLFFLIAGYFVPRSFERKGASQFLKSRFIRFGLPALFVAWILFAPMVYLTQDPRPAVADYVRYLYGTGWQVPYVYLWFLLHLLLYSFVYLLWRQIPRRQGRGESRMPLPTPVRSSFLSPPWPWLVSWFASGIPLIAGRRSSI